MERVLTYLEQLDLSEVEAKLYLKLLETGPISVRDLAKTIGVKRTTAYIYIDQLVEKGLIMKVVKGSNKLVAASDPAENLKYLVQQKLTSAKAIQEQFPLIEKEISNAFPHVNDVIEAEIKYYKGKQGVKKIYEEALKGSELRIYANLSELANLLMPNNLNLDLDLFEHALVENPTLQIFEMIADNDESVKKFNLDNTAKNNRYRYKFIPSSVGLTAPGILIYDKKVAIINGGKKLSSVVLYNNDYYVNSKKLFDFIWSMLPKGKK